MTVSKLSNASNRKSSEPINFKHFHGISNSGLIILKVLNNFVSFQLKSVYIQCNFAGIKTHSQSGQYSGKQALDTVSLR